MSWKDVITFFKTLTLNRLLPAIVILAVGVVLVRLLVKLFDRGLQHSKLDRTMFGLLRTVMRILLYTIVILIALSSLGVDVTSLVALLSVLSLAISLAVQNALANFFGSITLLATHPFHVGDYIEIGADSGTVEEIGMSYTTIMTFDGKRIYIPNSDAASARICNYTAEGKRRVDLVIGASYEDDISLVKETLLGIVPAEKLLPDTKAEVCVNAYKDSCVEYVLKFWVKDTDYWDVYFAANEAIKREFDRAGISIPYPQITVHSAKA